MPSFLANTVVTLLVGASQPASQPSDVPNLAGLSDAERGIRQLDQRLQRMQSELNRIPTTEIKPYGPSFLFNGVRVYVEPVALASTPVSRPK